MWSDARGLRASLVLSIMSLGLILLAPPMSQAEKRLYTCYEEESVGFVVGEGMRQVNWKLGSFNLEYDTDSVSLISEEVFVFGNLPPMSKCGINFTSAYITCNSSDGDAFAFKANELSFVRTGVNASWPIEGAAQTFGQNHITYGKCRLR